MINNGAPKPTFNIDTVGWETHAPELQLLRKRVFIDEQNVPVEEEWDNRDADAWHVVAKDANGRVVGTARVLKTGQIGRMAVLRELRGLGLGAAILKRALKCAQDNQLPAIFLHAQTHAIPFYKKLGFIAEGNEFMDAGIPHRNMVYKNVNR